MIVLALAVVIVGALGSAGLLLAMIVLPIIDKVKGDK